MTRTVSVAFNDDRSRAAVTLFHPKGNCITLEMLGMLRVALEEAANQPHLKLLTLEGAGDDFSFGASIPEHAPESIGEVLPAMHRLIEELLDLPAVTAAVVRGRCLGGGFELGLACDFIFAAEDAEFGLPEIALGVFPPAAATLLPWRVGGARATRAILTGESRTAAAWFADGLIEAVSSADDLDRAVDGWFAQYLAPRSASALRHAAAAIRGGLRAELHAHLPRLERLYLDELMRTADAVEGVAAFLQKRPPRWIDR